MENLVIPNASKVVDLIIEAIGDSIDEEQSLKVDGLIAELGERYFTSPASTKESHHSSYPGGLAVHSYHVMDLMFSLRYALEDQNGPFWPGRAVDISDHSLALVGLFHDLGKIGTVDGVPQYLDQDSQWHKDKLGQVYKFNEDLDDALTVSQRSIRILTHFGVQLSDAEYRAILYHDGWYVEHNRIPSVMISNCPLMRITQFADSYSAFVHKV